MAWSKAAVAFMGAMEIIGERPFVKALFDRAAATVPGTYTAAQVLAFVVWWAGATADTGGNWVQVYDECDTPAYKTFLKETAIAVLTADKSSMTSERDAQIAELNA